MTTDPTSPADSRSSMAPPYADDDNNIALVQLGLDEAENETREAVTDRYEELAQLSDESSDILDDIDFAADEGDEVAPEIAAMQIE